MNKTIEDALLALEEKESWDFKFKVLEKEIERLSSKLSEETLKRIDSDLVKALRIKDEQIDILLKEKKEIRLKVLSTRENSIKKEIIDLIKSRADINSGQHSGKTLKGSLKTIERIIIRDDNNPVTKDCIFIIKEVKNNGKWV